jgi:hypothetical protein
LAVLALPFVILGSRPGLEVVHPMAVVILGGLVTATFLGLLVLPALYLRYGAGTSPQATDEEELLQRWLGFEPEPAAAAAATGPDGRPAADAGPPPQEQRAPDGGGSSVGAETGPVS